MIKNNIRDPVDCVCYCYNFYNCLRITITLTAQLCNDKTFAVIIRLKHESWIVNFFQWTWETIKNNREKTNALKMNAQEASLASKQGNY